MGPPLFASRHRMAPSRAVSACTTPQCSRCSTLIKARGLRRESSGSGRTLEQHPLVRTPPSYPGFPTDRHQLQPSDPSGSRPPAPQQQAQRHPQQTHSAPSHGAPVGHLLGGSGGYPPSQPVQSHPPPYMQGHSMHLSGAGVQMSHPACPPYGQQPPPWSPAAAHFSQAPQFAAQGWQFSVPPTPRGAHPADSSSFQQHSQSYFVPPPAYSRHPPHQYADQSVQGSAPTHYSTYLAQASHGAGSQFHGSAWEHPPHTPRFPMGGGSQGHVSLHDARFVSMDSQHSEGFGRSWQAPPGHAAYPVHNPPMHPHTGQQKQQAQGHSYIKGVMGQAAPFVGGPSDGVHWQRAPTPTGQPRGSDLHLHGLRSGTAGSSHPSTGLPVGLSGSSHSDHSSPHATLQHRM